MKGHKSLKEKDDKNCAFENNLIALDEVMSGNTDAGILHRSLAPSSQKHPLDDVMTQIISQKHP